MRRIGTGDTVKITQSELRAMSLAQLRDLLESLGLDSNQVGTESAALTLISQQIVHSEA